MAEGNGSYGSPATPVGSALDAVEYPSLHAALDRFGIHSKRNPNSVGKRTLYRAGEPIGNFDARDGWVLVAELEADAA